jgi:hypothetical protein
MRTEPGTNYCCCFWDNYFNTEDKEGNKEEFILTAQIKLYSESGLA